MDVLESIRLDLIDQFGTYSSQVSRHLTCAGAANAQELIARALKQRIGKQDIEAYLDRFRVVEGYLRSPDEHVPQRDTQPPTVDPLSPYALIFVEIGDLPFVRSSRPDSAYARGFDAQREEVCNNIVLWVMCECSLTALSFHRIRLVYFVVHQRLSPVVLLSTHYYFVCVRVSVASVVHRTQSLAHRRVLPFV